VRAAEAAVATAKLNLGFAEVRSPNRRARESRDADRSAIWPGRPSVLTSVVSQDSGLCLLPTGRQTFLAHAELARKGARENGPNAVRVGLATDKNYPYTGTVNFINNQVDPATGRSIAGVVPNPDRIFTPACTWGCKLEVVPTSGHLNLTTGRDDRPGRNYV